MARTELLEGYFSGLRDPLREEFFAQQKINEKNGGYIRPEKKKRGHAPNFSDVAINTYKKFQEVCTGLFPSLSKKDALHVLKEFSKDIGKVSTQDTHYEGLDHALRGLFESADGVSLWTFGFPHLQPQKIRTSGILEDFQKASEGRRGEHLSPIISRDKVGDVYGFLNSYAKDTPIDQEIVLIIYDDSPNNFIEAEEKIKRFEEKTGRKIIRKNIFAFTGRATDKYCDYRLSEEEQIEQKKVNGKKYIDVLREKGVETAFSIFALGKFAERTREEFPDARILALIDYDGALSDNRVLRLRQGNVFIEHLTMLIDNHLRVSGVDEDKIPERREAIYLQLREKLVELDRGE